MNNHTSISSLNLSVTLEWEKEKMIVESKDVPKSTFFQAIFSGIEHEGCSLVKKNVYHMSSSISKEFYDCLIKIYTMDLEDSIDHQELPNKKWKELTKIEWNIAIEKTCEKLIVTAIDPLLKKEKTSTAWFNEIEEKLKLLMNGSCQQEVADVFRKLCLYRLFDYDSLTSIMIAEHMSTHQEKPFSLMIQEAREALQAIEKTINSKYQAYQKLFLKTC